MRAEKTDREKIAEITDPEELGGYRNGLEFHGRMTPELDNLLKLRDAEIKRKQP